MLPLPIDDVLDELREALRDRSCAVLQAPPGAGKTTRVPLALLKEGWLGRDRIVMLEPRRLAARAAARHMAGMLRERVGATVGYRVRLDSRVGKTTRVEVVTEGVLTRRLQDDPTLDGVGLVIFDEIHERSIHTDLGLALTLETQRLLRPELRLLAMSATLEGPILSRALGGAPVITSEGRQFSVRTQYIDVTNQERLDIRRLEARVESTVATALRAEAGDGGDVLVFLPGAAEIRRVAARLEQSDLGPAVTIAPLYGNLPAEEQDRAILPSPPGRRKVVLATSIAETSLTIDGVRIVVDSGLSRVSRFSPRTGMSRLETVRVSRASADQRRGRAGRQAPGVCYRLWPETEDLHLLARTTPEILEADLAPLALELAAAGIVDPSALTWLDLPPAAPLAQARDLLLQLGAIDETCLVTAHGRQLSRLGVHPRLAHMLVRGREDGHGALACALAALLEERDILRFDGSVADADIRIRLDVLRAGRATAAGALVDHDALRRARMEADRLARVLGVSDRSFDDDVAGVLLALAYPDRLALRRGGRGRFTMRNGHGAVVDASSSIANAELLAIAAVDGRQPESRVFLAAPLERAALEELFAAEIAEERVISWDDAADAVVARQRRRLGALVLDDHPLRDVDEQEIAMALTEGVAREGISALPWSESARHLRQRLAFLHTIEASWPDVADSALESRLRQWLLPRVAGMRSRREVARLDLAAALLDLIDWRQRARLDHLAPTHVVVPSGSRLPIDYSDPLAPALFVRLQEMFGLADTPRIADGRVPLTLHLLSPAHRPVQVTRDLDGFWKSSYLDVRKDLRGRYPKHHWPDDPLAAQPTNRAKSKSN